MWKEHSLKLNLHLMELKNHNSIGIGFSTIVHTYSVGVNEYFHLRRTHISLTQPTYRPSGTKYIID